MMLLKHHRIEQPPAPADADDLAMFAEWLALEDIAEQIAAIEASES